SAPYAGALVATLAEAVQVAHHWGIIHRDLKPGNILRQESGIRNQESTQKRPPPAGPCPLSPDSWIPKIADFGLARNCDLGPGLTLSGARVGTPSYMAPEQALGKTRSIGPAADIYALGAVLYEMLTGRPPFRGETAMETELQVVNHEPVPPSRLNPQVPR